jgi:hypothetical protein
MSWQRFEGTGNTRQAGHGSGSSLDLDALSNPSAIEETRGAMAVQIQLRCWTEAYAADGKVRSKKFFHPGSSEAYLHGSSCDGGATVH